MEQKSDKASVMPGALEPVAAEPLADPFVFEQDGWYYVSGTTRNSRFFRTHSFIPDDIQWFEPRIDFGSETGRVQGIWALRFYRHSDGTFHAYASLHYGHFRTIVAHLVPARGEKWTKQRPVLSWVLDGLLVGDLKLGYFAYDSCAVRDEKGALYLVYCSGHPNEVLGVDIHVKARKMLDPGRLDPAYAPRPILSPDGYPSEDRNPNFIQITEGAILRNVAGKYVLSYSVGDFQAGNYKIGLAYSDKLIPPTGRMYQKIVTAEPEVAYLLQSESPNGANYVGNVVCGPGIGNIIELNGVPHLIFHGRVLQADGTPGRDRCVFKLPLRLNISSLVSRDQWVVPEFPR